jgi:hypothetical protein
MAAQLERMRAMKNIFWGSALAALAIMAAPAPAQLLGGGGGLGGSLGG